MTAASVSDFTTSGTRSSRSRSPPAPARRGGAPRSPRQPARHRRRLRGTHGRWPQASRGEADQHRIRAIGSWPVGCEEWLVRPDVQTGLTYSRRFPKCSEMSGQPPLPSHSGLVLLAVCTCAPLLVTLGAALLTLVGGCYGLGTWAGKALALTRRWDPTSAADVGGVLLGGAGFAGWVGFASVLVARWLT